MVTTELWPTKQHVAEVKKSLERMRELHQQGHIADDVLQQTEEAVEEIVQARKRVVTESN